jgi:hypothetical protein
MILRRVRRLPAHLRRRRLHLYGVGCTKSGTMTLARMFDNYCAAHEVDAARFIPISVGVLNGEYALDSRRVRFEVRRRNARFHLEVDSAAFLNPVAGALSSAFPHARFVLTLRDCFSWLDSRVEWELKIPPRRAPVFGPLRAALYDQYPEDFAPEEAALRNAGLRPLASYLRAWSEENTAVLHDVPSESLLVVRTEDLNDAADVLARFAGVPEGTVHPAHANANDERVGLLAEIPREFIVERAREHCATLMEEYWGPDWNELQDRIAVRTSRR